MFTKEDAKEMRAETKAEMREMRAETKAEMKEMRAEMKKMRAELELRMNWMFAISTLISLLNPLLGAYNTFIKDK